MKYYTGIGARKTPKDILSLMTKISLYLSKKGYILRSGGAEGADKAFEEGVLEELKEIFLPWPNFNNNKANFVPISKEAMEMAKKYHPYWINLKEGAKKLQARNCYQVLGKNLDKPSNFVICWTPGGKEIGGTSQALRIAKNYNIKIFNLGNKKDLDRISKKIEEKF